MPDNSAWRAGSRCVVVGATVVATSVVGATVVGVSVVVDGGDVVAGGEAVVVVAAVGGAEDGAVASSSDEQAPAVTIRPAAARAIETRPRRWIRVLEMEVLSMQRMVRCRGHVIRLAIDGSPPRSSPPCGRLACP